MRMKFLGLSKILSKERAQTIAITQHSAQHPAMSPAELAAFLRLHAYHHLGRCRSISLLPEDLAQIAAEKLARGGQSVPGSLDECARFLATVVAHALIDEERKYYSQK